MSTPADQAGKYGEPWTTEFTAGCEAWLFDDDCVVLVHSMADCEDDVAAEQQERMFNRIVACVNALSRVEHPEKLCEFLEALRTYDELWYIQEWLGKLLDGIGYYRGGER